MASRTHLERLGLRFYFDTNFVDDQTPAAMELRSLHDAGWIGLQRTDTVDTELAGDEDEERRTALLATSAEYVESFGPGIVGHSRTNHAVTASVDDRVRLNAVYAILFPGSDRRDSSTGRARGKLRDAMHVATAIRYGADGFITRDRRDLLRKADQIAAAFDSFRIVPPEVALAFVRRMKQRWDVRQRQPRA
jgi:hypothetical protein